MTTSRKLDKEHLDSLQTLRESFANNASQLGSVALEQIAINRRLEYLNSDPEDYEGGDLELMPGNYSFAVPKKKGAVVLFPSFILHRVTPVTSGLRRSAVLWVGGSHYK